MISSASSAASTQQSPEVSQSSSTNPHSSIPPLSQATASSGSIFCPDTQSQSTQTSHLSSSRVGGSSYIASTQNQSSDHTQTPRTTCQYSQDFSIPDSTADTWILESTASSYTLRGRTLTSTGVSHLQQPYQESEQSPEFSIYPSKTSLGAASKNSALHSTSREKGHDQRNSRAQPLVLEVLETPPSQLLVRDRLEDSLSQQLDEPGFEIDSPISRRIITQSSSGKLTHPFLE